MGRPSQNLKRAHARAARATIVRLAEQYHDPAEPQDQEDVHNNSEIIDLNLQLAADVDSELGLNPELFNLQPVKATIESEWSPPAAVPSCSVRFILCQTTVTSLNEAIKDLDKKLKLRHHRPCGRLDLRWHDQVLAFLRGRIKHPNLAPNAVARAVAIGA